MKLGSKKYYIQICYNRMDFLDIQNDACFSYNRGHMLLNFIGIFNSPKCDVNPQPNTRGIGPLVGRTSGTRRNVMHVLAVI